ncbi:sugar ABC transporter ATP-binding protein [Anaerosacchariphilus polymeriproducens]|uniref:Sugar ABC transporter ATP-binding protein n=1 Tax=Anaerosacchariphilus polymeriproducens TaxID=1812858 RepID=A0A371ASN3_9FIRM|nr:sugar ABC transporter ATP-binding protein [Anaerosacchariphilus polymeriproducens]RDU22559.1 sugar ABC transporter ATP-binding protein [Anaerosacchariphilus polymeriproducens]
MKEAKSILQLQNIKKTYPGVVALNKVDLELKEGEIHGLVGENGAGKSTLIKTCTGATIPDSGKIIINGIEYAQMNPKLAENNGLAVIYQEFNLVGELSVAENIFLGRAIRKGIMIDKKAMEEETEKIFKQFQINIAPDELVKNLTVGYQQLVEIAKAISQNARILIMDEPSAPLTKSEVERLYEMIERLKKAGVTILYISHRLDEIFYLTDRITVLRDGEKVQTLYTKDTYVDELVTLMVGRELKETFPPRTRTYRNEVLLEAQHLTGNGLKDISFEIKKGEVLGFAGLIGAGRTELAEIIFGVKARTSGKIFFKGKEIAPKTPREAIDHGIALVPEDRKQQGALLDMEIKSNITMTIMKNISNFSVINKKEEKNIASKYKEELKIKTPYLEQKVKNLSGGNQQKVILGKWLAADSELIILDEPTRGIDIGAKYEIYKLINKLVESGKTVLMISSEMEELMGMSDRIIVLAEGKITGEVRKEEFTQELIMSYASKTGGKL